MDTSTDIIQTLGTPQAFDRGAFLFQAGDPARGFYYVQSGEVRIYRMDVHAREVEIGRLGPGDFLGEAIIFIAPTYPLYAQAVKKTACLFFDKEAVFTAIDKNPSVARTFVQLLAQKCVTLNKRIDSLSLQTVRQRLIQFLLTHAQGSPATVTLKMKKIELAKSLGTIAETLSRNLRQLQADELVHIQGKTIQLLDTVRLTGEISDV